MPIIPKTYIHNFNIVVELFVSLHRIRPDTANNYNTFQSLNSPDSVNELANIGVSRTAVPGSKARRIGPEFARKLHTLFTATDGDILLD